MIGPEPQQPQTDPLETHQQAYKKFNQRMSAIRQEDLTKFFAEVVPQTRSENDAAGQAVTTEGDND